MQIKMTVPDKMVAGLLCCALEGGSNYWYRIEDYKKPLVEPVNLGDFVNYRHIAYPLSKTGALFIRDMTTNKVYKLNKTKLRRGLELMAEKMPRHFSCFVNESEDSVTGDIFLQLCLFKEVIYG